MDTQIETIHFEEKPEWLKVVLPVQRNWPLFILFTICLVIWIIMLSGVVSAMLSQNFGFVLNVMLLVWLAIWLWFGRVLWRRWQFYAAVREVLFLNEEQLIVRRPVSILGTTHVYDMNHVSPFYFSDKHLCPAFDYAYQHVYFGQDLTSDRARQLVDVLNKRFHPDQIYD